MNGSVLVLNADLGPLHRVTLRHAIRMLCRQVAEVHDTEPDIRYAPFGGMPTIVRLLRYVVPKWRYNTGPLWSRRNIMLRDGKRCGYCRSTATTIDHILPSSRGGKSTWTNTVAACSPCNQRKSDKTPAEAGMVLHVTPVAPSWAMMLPAQA